MSALQCITDVELQKKVRPHLVLSNSIVFQSTQDKMFCHVICKTRLICHIMYILQYTLHCET